MDRKRLAHRDVPMLPEQRVGAALRCARQAAGIGLRDMARRLNYGSHSTLSEYENGARMPSERVVTAYERVLCLATGTLMAALEAANIERHGDAWIRRLPHAALGFPHQSLSPDGGTGPRAVGASPFPRQPVVDGSDPDAAGCSANAVTIHARRIALAERKTVIGQIELRYCSRSHAAWGRFEGYAYLDHVAEGRNDVCVVIEVVRHSDGTRLAAREPYCFDYMWSDLVVADSGMFQARAMVLLGDDAVATGETDARWF